jgi:hypothetical protein
MTHLQSLVSNSLCLALALTGSSAYAQDYRPAVKLSSQNFAYKANAATIKGVKFSDLTYPLGDENVTLKNGAFDRDEAGNFANANLQHIWPFDIVNGEPRRALVSLNYTFGGGSSNSNGFLFVFEIRDGHPVITQRFVYDAQAGGAGESFNAATGKLIVKGRSNDDSPHCCAKSLDEVTYSWTARGFVRTSRRVLPIRQP